MATRLPPLNTLRAFEAAARHMSFTKAADELFVTQAAVSHQIKTLEDALGVKLFKRLNRALLLTEEGQTFIPPVRQALDLLMQGVNKISQVEATGALNVSTMPSFAAGWLVPRLDRFRKQHPEIDVRLTASERLVDFARDDVEMAIRYGRGQYPGLTCERFIDEEIFPVCSPKLVEEGPHPLKRPEDLKYHTLLHDDMPVGWAQWFEAAGVGGINPSQGPYFDMSALVIQAAIQGQGVALGRSTLAATALESGMLVKPFDLTMKMEYAYFVVCPPEHHNRPKVRVFREWLYDEAEKAGVLSDRSPHAAEIAAD
ncbi:transcriptional regulator GcvA [Hwanghaeella grinnelliae]|uniref:Transcriptional regulator GcvA n=1 Tax=Hwanghaeella grinnelliae TaxID=2500179 RepID=A0A437QP75_9PROT|nr:transcriptional regulator GcvA [Hwanghaeella grinnelliae]RVU36342.1 transcriptional regulator GcvA [Hwanghaeella grinnelliae]